MMNLVMCSGKWSFVIVRLASVPGRDAPGIPDAVFKAEVQSLLKLFCTEAAAARNAPHTAEH